MTKTAKQYRTAASVLEVIQESVDQERRHLSEARARVDYREAKVEALLEVLKVAEKGNGSDDEC